MNQKRERKSATLASMRVKREKDSKVALNKVHTIIILKKKIIIILFVPTRKVVFVHFLNGKVLQEQTPSKKGS